MAQIVTMPVSRITERINTQVPDRKAGKRIQQITPPRNGITMRSIGYGFHGFKGERI
jgi:hypothetical protein